MVRRPLFFAAVSFCCAIIICFFLGRTIGIIVSIALILLRLIKFKSFYNRQLMIVTAFFCISIFNYIIYDSSWNFYDNYTGESISAEGLADKIQIKKNSKDDKYLQITFDAEKINGRKCERRILNRREKLLISFYGENAAEYDILPGSRIYVKGMVEEPSGKRNPNCFDYSLYLKSVGIGKVMRAEHLEVIDCDMTFEGKLYLMKTDFTDRIEAAAGSEAAALIKGIMFGDKTDIEQDVLVDFQRNGTAHILAVSGLHIGIIYGFIAGIWRWKKGGFYFAFITLFLGSYCVWASFSPSVLRAVFMTELHLVSRLLKCRYDLGSAAFLICMIMLVINPMQLFNVGFQMSFIAVLTLTAILPYINRFYSGVFAAGTAVQAGLVPYIMYVFNYFSPAAFVVNVPVIFLAGIIVPLGLCSFVMSFLCQPVFQILSEVMGGLCMMLQSANSFTCMEGVTSFDVTSPSRVFMALYYLGILIFFSEEGRLMIIRRKTGIIKLMIVSCVLTSILFGSITESGFEKTDVVFVDVGQGDCIHLKTGEGKNYFIDGGGNVNYNVGEKTLKPYLLKNHVRKLDGAFVTHLHTDHYKGIAELCRMGMVKKLFLYEGNKVKEKEIIRDTGLSHEDIIYLQKGQTVELGDNSKIEILWPEGKSRDEYNRLITDDADENDVSLILMANIDGTQMMITGDIDNECERKLAASYGNRLHADILKVPHHGSRYSYDEKFAEYVSPQYAVFQVGKNNYGHPASEVIKNYKEKDAEVYRCDKDGAVGFYLNSRMKVVTVLR